MVGVDTKIFAAEKVLIAGDLTECSLRVIFRGEASDKRVVLPLCCNKCNARPCYLTLDAPLLWGGFESTLGDHEGDSKRLFDLRGREPDVTDGN